MYAVKVLRALGPMDIKNVRRDALLRWMILAPILIALGVRWLLPYLNRRLSVLFDFYISDYYTLAVGILMVTLAVLFGMVIGFLLLDQRDDRTLTAIQVTPLSLNGYFIYRIGMPILLTVVMIPLVMPLTGLIEIRPLPLVLVAIEAAPLAPIFSLALASFAQNKVQGFALSKASGVLFVAPLVAYFVPLPWQALFGIVPTYWPAKLYWAFLYGEPALAYFLVGLLYQALLLKVLVKRFNQVINQ